MDYKTFPDESKAKQRASESSVITTSELCCDDEDKVSKSPLRDFLVVLALTFHAVLEGTAVGLEKDLNDIWILFAGTVVAQANPDSPKNLLLFKKSIIFT